MGFAALFKGAADAVNQNLDAGAANDLATQRMLLQDWTNTTLPQVQRQRQLDDEALSQVNTLLGTKQFQDNPMMAFHAVKTIQAGGAKSGADYLDQVNNGRIQLPQDAKDAQLTNLQSQGLSYNKDDQGTITGFSYKPQARATSANIPGVNTQPQLSSLLAGKGNMGADVKTAADNFATATGVDPTQGVSSKFNQVNTGGLGLDLKSPKSEKLQDAATDALARDPTYTQNYGKLISAMASGDQNQVTALLKSPGFVRSRQDIEADQFNKQFRLNMAEHLGEFKNPGAVGEILAKGGSTSAIMKVVGDNTYTGPEKQKLALDLHAAETFTGDLSNPDAVLMLNQAGALGQLAEKGLISKAAIPGMVAQAQKLHDDKQTLANAMMKGALGGAGSNSKDNNAAPVTPPAQPEPQQTPQPNPQATPNPTPTPTPAQPETQPGGAPNAVPLPGKGDLPRVGDPAPGTPIKFMYDDKIQKTIESSDDTFIQHVNPFTAVQAAQHLATTGKTAQVGKIVRNIVVTPADQAVMAKDDKVAHAFSKTVQSYRGAVTYPSMEKAAKTVPIGGLFYVESAGMTSVAYMTQALKDKYSDKAE